MMADMPLPQLHAADLHTHAAGERGPAVDCALREMPGATEASAVAAPDVRRTDVWDPSTQVSYGAWQ
jgi:hypothetical protein